MTIEYSIPYKGKEIDVEFFGEPYWMDNSYSDEYGLAVIPQSPSMIEEEITWDKKLYSKKQNHEIEKWLSIHLDFMEGKFCKLLREEIKQH